MNIEEKIKRKEKRKNRVKKIWIPLICILIIVGIVLEVVYFGISKNNIQNEEIKDENNQENEIDYNQIIGTNVGENKIVYKEYVYEYGVNNLSGLCRRKSNEEEFQEVVKESENGYEYKNIAIYKDKIYLVDGSHLKTFNLDGSNEQNIIDNCSDLIYDFDKEKIYYTYYDDNNNGIGISKISGETIKKTPSQEDDVSIEILNADDTNVYYTSTPNTPGMSSYSDTSLITLYSFNKENYKTKKIKTEEVNEGSSSGFYQLACSEDYLYYVVGCQQGTLNVFYGKACKIKKDGTGYEELSLGDTDFSRGIIPELLIKNGYLYVDGNRINLSTNKQTTDKFKNGDKIDDDDYVYTTSMSDDKAIILTKYKAGTEYEDMQKIFTKEIPDNENADLDTINIEIDGNYIYLSIDYTDNDTENWRPLSIGGETYRMKKDGSDLKEL